MYEKQVRFAAGVSCCEALVLARVLFNPVQLSIWLLVAAIGRAIGMAPAMTTIAIAPARIQQFQAP